MVFEPDATTTISPGVDAAMDIDTRTMAARDLKKVIFMFNDFCFNNRNQT